jgi:SAM-dependent methyltransferase
MTVEIAELGYESKSADYFQCERPEMLPFVPAHCRRVLDIGCAEGAFGESLKKSRGIEVWGVEPVKSAATTAMAKLDRVIEGVFGPGTALPAGTFDCICFNDVLEHMPAPEMALRYARDLLAPGGVVVASIPNVQYFPMVWQLMIYGRWEYEDAGILDRTHLRFFTRSSIVNMFEREGFTMGRVCGINAYNGYPNVRRRLWRAFRLANGLLLGNFDDMRFPQFAVVAKVRDRLESGQVTSRV